MFARRALQETSPQTMAPSARRRRPRLALGDDDDVKDENDDVRAGAAPRANKQRDDDGALASLMSYGLEEDARAREEEEDALRALGWKRAMDKATGREYYYNKSTGRSSWTKPTVLGANEEEEAPGETLTKRHENGWSETRGTTTTIDGEVKPEEKEVLPDVRTFARSLRDLIEEKCPDVFARVAATPDVVFRYRELVQLADGADGTENEVLTRWKIERMLAIERGLDADVSSYEEWTREVEADATDVDEDKCGLSAAAEEERATDEAAMQEAKSLPKGTIVRAPAPPLPTGELSRPPPPEEKQKPKRQKLAAVSNTKGHKGDMSKWAKLRETESDERDGAKSAEAMKAKRAQELENWRAEKIRSGADSRTNPNFVPVGDWRARVAAANKNAKLEDFRARHENAAAAAEGSKGAVQPPEEPPKKPIQEEEEAQLPAGWRAFYDETSGDIYYGNVETKETTWERPTS
jgi:hypothetical protein